MRKIALPCLLLLAMLLPFHQAGAQTFLESRKGQDREMSFSEFEAAFAQWRSETDLTKVKGWKWLSRWEDFHARRSTAGGGTMDWALYANAAEGVMAQKSAYAMRKSGSGWLPYGPDNYAINNTGYMNNGIGRINCITFHPTDSATFWVGVAQGGVWKTTDSGNSWTPLTDDLPMLRISDIAVDPNNPDVMYISLGDYAYFGAGLTLDDRKRHTHYGLGVYKTTDGGLTWSPTGLSVAQTDFDFSLTRRTFVHPSNSQELLAAGTHGIYRSSDGGANWTQISDSLIWDIEQDPSNPDVIYASTGYRSTLNEGSASILKSTDFGDSWSTLPTGIPAIGVIQRIEIGISPSSPSTVYALCADMDAAFGGLYRSTNAGSSWSLMANQSTAPNILTWDDGFGGGGQGWYDLAILVDPSSPDKVYTGGINMWATTDGGLTFDGVSHWTTSYGPSLHADLHFFAYNPLSGKYYVCTDGGLYSTTNIQIGSWDDAVNVPGYVWPTNWTPLSGGMQATSFYRLGTSQNNPGYLIAGAQDNSTYYYDDFNGDWYNIIGGDGMNCLLHPDDPSILIGSWQYGGLSVSFDGGFTTNDISWGIPETGEWTTPFLLDSTDRIVAAYGNIWTSGDYGNNWNVASNFPVNGFLGQPNISSAFAMGVKDYDYMYVAKRFYDSAGEPSKMWVSENGGSTWQDRSAGLPDSLYITGITVDDSDPLTAWITLGGFTAGQKVYRTDDGGQSWANISDNLPNLPVNCVVHHDGMANDPVYVGTDLGVWYRNDTLSAWELYSQDLPNAIVSDLEIHYSSGIIYAATFGRGIWGADLRDELFIGIDESEWNAIGMEVYPNPSNGNFRLRMESLPFREAELEIIDLMGRQVFNESLHFEGAAFEQEYAPALSGGVYYLRVRHGERSLTQKLVIR